MFQTLDDKGECVGIYKEGELYFNEIPKNLNKTWNYVSFLEGQDIEYASIYALGKSLDEVCPPELKLQWDNINKKLRSLVSSFVEAPNEASAGTSWVALGNLMEILVALMVLAKVVINLTPTEKDNKVFGLVDSILNTIVPDRRKA